MIKRRKIGQESFQEVAADTTDIEFEILQGYRDFEDDVLRDRAAVARSGDIEVAMQRLDEINTLFNKAGWLGNNLNSVYAQDSHAVMSVSELASISVRNLKLGDSGKVLNVNEIVNLIKRYMLKEYFLINRSTDTCMGREPGIEDGHEGNSIDFLTRSSGFEGGRLQCGFLNKFETYNEFSQFNWARMGAMFQNLSRMPMTVDHMLGPLAVGRKQRVITQRCGVEKVGEKARAENVTNKLLTVNQPETTPEQVKKCFNILMEKNGYSQINLFRYIIDPSSYARSVEHLFYTSFLIKEGKLVLEDDEEGFPAIRPKEPLPRERNEKEIEKQRRTDTQQKHIIFQMDMTSWRKLIKRFEIKESFL